MRGASRAAGFKFETNPEISRRAPTFDPRLFVYEATCDLRTPGHSPAEMVEFARNVLHEKLGVLPWQEAQDFTGKDTNSLLFYGVAGSPATEVVVGVHNKTGAIRVYNPDPMSELPEMVELAEAAYKGVAKVFSALKESDVAATHARALKRQGGVKGPQPLPAR